MHAAPLAMPTSGQGEIGDRQAADDNKTDEQQLL
jgi:hypothetical protein